MIPATFTVEKLIVSSPTRLPELNTTRGLFVLGFPDANALMERAGAQWVLMDHGRGLAWVNPRDVEELQMYLNDYNKEVRK